MNLEQNSPGRPFLKKRKERNQSCEYDQINHIYPYLICTNLLYTISMRLMATMKFTSSYQTVPWFCPNVELQSYHKT